MINENCSTQVIRGLPFPCYPEFTRGNIEDVMDYNPKDNDLIIASYPKSGTTWLEYMVLQIVSKATLFPTFDEMLWKIVPFMEMVGVDVIEAAPEPRIFKHHLPYNMVRKNGKAKCLYIYRNPEDVAVSYHQFLQSYDEDHPIDFDIFFEYFITGNIGFGSCFDHVLSYYARREDPNLLMVSYEQLHANTKDEILRIAAFLGEEHYRDLAEDDALLMKVLENTSFQYMKKNLYMTHPDCQYEDGSLVDESDKKFVKFFRKGIVGDGKNVLTEAQRIQMRKKVEKKMKGTSILQEWLKN